MPKKNLEKKELTKQIGASFFFMDGEVFTGMTPDDIDIDTLYQMQKDETINAAAEYFTNMVLSFIGKYSNPDKKMEEFVNQALESLDRDIMSLSKSLVSTSLKYGWSAAEILWKVIDGKLLPYDVVPYDPRYLTIELKDGKQISVNQNIGMRGKVSIPVEKMIIFKIGSGVYGESWLKKVYRLWKMKKEFIKSWAIAIEKFAVPIVWGKTKNVEVTTEDGTKKSSVELLNEALKGFYRKTAITTDNETELKYLTTGVGGVHFSKIYIDALEYLNRLIFRNFLLPNLLLGSDTTGSYSLGNVHYKLFKSATKGIARQFANEIIDQLVYRIITYNFGETKEYGEFTIIDELTPEEREQLSKVLVNLVNAGFVDPIEDKNIADDMLKLPR